MQDTDIDKSDTETMSPSTPARNDWRYFITKPYMEQEESFLDRASVKLRLQEILPTSDITTLCLSTEWNVIKRRATLQVLLWQADGCQGCMFQTISIAFGSCQEIQWTRHADPSLCPPSTNAADMGNDHNKTRQEIFDDLFNLFLPFVGDQLLIQSVAIESVTPLARALIRHAHRQEGIGMRKLQFYTRERGGSCNKVSILCLVYLCGHVLRHANIPHVTAGELLVPINKPLFPKAAMQYIWQSAQHNAVLQTWNLQAGRRIYTWSKSYSRHRSVNGDNNHDVYRVDISELIEVLPTTVNLRHLDLSGHYLTMTSSATWKTFMHTVQTVGVERLSLRDTALSSEALVEILDSLGSNVECNKNSLRELDLSHNSFTVKVMTALIRALGRETNTLQALTVEHVGMDLELVTPLARALGSFCHLQHLSLDGNPFCREPLEAMQEGRLVLLEGNDAKTALLSRREDVSSVGALRLVEGLQERTTPLLWLRMGDDTSYWGMVCCTSPRYRAHMSDDATARLHSLLARNLQAYRDHRRDRMRHAVVNIVNLLLSKSTNEQKQQQQDKEHEAKEFCGLTKMSTRMLQEPDEHAH